MCRLLSYLGQPVLLDRLISQSDHSLVVQSYQPKEMTAGLLNADGLSRLRIAVPYRFGTMSICKV